MTDTTTVVLVRHGESLWNAERRIQGQSGAGLSPRGHEQARHTAAWVATTHPDALVVASDLDRAVETAAPIGTALGLDVPTDETLRERHFGDWQGRLVADLDADDPDRGARWRRGVDVIGEVGGESDEVFRKRVHDALEAVAEAHAGGTVVVVSHGGFVWHGIHALLDLPIPTLGPVQNACTSTVVRRGDRWSLDAWNQTAHLPPELQGTHAGNANTPPAGR